MNQPCCDGASSLAETHVEDLESVNVEYTDNVGRRRLRLHRDVDAVDDPIEEIVVDGLCERITNSGSLCGVQRYLVNRS